MNALLTWLVDGVVIALVATVAARCIPSSAPAHRHLFWWLTLAVVLAVPWLPSISLGTLVSRSAAAAPGAAAGAALTIQAPPQWLLAAASLAWAVFAAVSVVRLVRNLRAVRRLASRAEPLNSGRVARLAQVERAMAGSRRARICVSTDVRGACAVGFGRPTVLLSHDLVATLNDQAIEAIVLHEYAHLQRYDDWTRLIQRVVLTVAGVHPAVRWVSRQIDIEREAACDRMVIDRTGAPVVYARSLAAAADIASRMNGLTPVAVPGAPLVASGLHARLARLLTSVPVRPAVTWLTSIGSAAGLMMATTIAAVLPPLLAVATLERPLVALASVPLRGGVLRELPAGANAVLQKLGARPAVPRESSRSVDTSAVDGDPVQSNSGAAASAPREPEPVPHGSDTSTVSTESSVTLPLLTATVIPPAHAVPLGTPDDGADAQAGIGSSAARLGAATGDAATRAGTSIGRFFKRRALAIANGF
jgi:beta-lactamase regulating signal transducer with metallopeptidase domain